MYSIDSDTINKFMALSFDNTTEQCCFLLLESKTNSIYLDSSSCSKGFSEKYTVRDKDGKYITKERAACSFQITSEQQQFAPFIIHSHPETSKPYPSYEDIKKVMYRHYIKASLISTSQGLWIISSSDSKVKRYIYDKYTLENGRLDHSAFDREFKTIIDVYLYRLYKLYVDNDRTALPDTPVQTIIEALNKKIKTNIQFYSWGDIIDKKFYFNV
jgi:proteasome lid subunit RPN8/RPN11